MESTGRDQRSAVAQAIREEYGPLSALPPPADEYLTPSGILLRCADLAHERGGSMTPAGISREGRTIWAYRNAERACGLFLVSLLHACEWIGGMVVLRLIESLAAAASGIAVTAIPIANPDGAMRAQASILEGKPRFVRGNARGIDLNRNFPGSFHGGGVWSRLPWYRPGPHAESEPETAAVARAARAARPSIAMSFHAFGQWIFYPPSSEYRPSPASERHAGLLAGTGDPARIGYRARQLGRWSRLFRAYGTEIDFLSRDLGALAYLIEVSGGGVGRWGLGRVLHPFFAYQPPRASEAIDPLIGYCLDLVRRAREEVGE